MNYDYKELAARAGFGTEENGEIVFDKRLEFFAKIVGEKVIADSKKVSKMNTVKVCELINDQLDLAVELALGTHWSANGYFIYSSKPEYIGYPYSKKPEWDYSKNWSKAGPIIKRYIILIDGFSSDNLPGGYRNWSATSKNGFAGHGPTPLIAAMRCFVGSKFGYEIEIPTEL